MTNTVEMHQGNLNEVNVSIAWSALGRSVRFSHKDRQELRSSKGYFLRDFMTLTEQVGTRDNIFPSRLITDYVLLF